MGARCARCDSRGCAVGFSEFSIAFMSRYWLHFEIATALLAIGIVAAWTFLREQR